MYIVRGYDNFHARHFWRETKEELDSLTKWLDTGKTKYTRYEVFEAELIETKVIK